jgi:hypothetical protein
MISMQISALALVLPYVAVTVFAGLFIQARKRKDIINQSNKVIAMVGKAMGTVALAGVNFVHAIGEHIEADIFAKFAEFYHHIVGTLQM